MKNGRKIFVINTPSVEGNMIMNKPRVKRYVKKYKRVVRTK